MQYISIVRRRTETFSEAEFAKFLDEEAEAVRRLYAQGIVRAAWSRTDVPGAVMLLEAASPQDAQSEVDALPLARRGMLEIRIIPLRGYRGFGPAV